jgi:hypothetical protein
MEHKLIHNNSKEKIKNARIQRIRLQAGMP